MNKKQKLLLPTIGLVVLSGIAATSTTFAWFTTVRSASVELTKAKVVTTDSNLIIAHAHTWNDPAVLVPASSGGDDTAIELTYTAAAGAKITDISGDGKDFYKPKWGNDPGVEAGAINTVTPGTVGDADGFLIDFTIKISRSSADGVEGMYVYLGAGTVFEPVAAAGDQLDKDNKAIAAARMSVYESTVAGVLGNKIFVHSPQEEPQATNSNYLAADASGTAYTVSGYTVKSNLDVEHAPFVTANTNAAASAVYDPIAYLAGAEVAAGSRVVDAYVNFRFWIEGTDKDAVNAAIEGEFTVSLDLYALPHDV